MVFVNATGGDEFIEMLLVNDVAFALEIGTVIAPFQWAFIPIDAKPTQTIVDRLNSLWSIPGLVGILNSQD